MIIDIRAKLIGAIAGLAALAIVLATLQGLAANNRLQASIISEKVRIADAATLKAAAGLALERGLTNIVLSANSHVGILYDHLIDARTNAIAASAAAITADKAAGLDTGPIERAMADLDAARSRAWTSIRNGARGETADWFASATTAVDAMLIAGRQMAGSLPQTAEVRLFVSFELASDLAEVAEHVGRQRGMVSGIIASGAPFTAAELDLVGRATGARSLSLLNGRVRAERLGPDYAAALGPADAAIAGMDQILQTILAASGGGAPYPIDAPAWFKIGTDTIAEVLAARHGIEQQIRADLNLYRAAATSAFALDLEVIAFCAGFAMVAVWVVLGQVIGPLRALQGAVDRLARADYDVSIPHVRRRDELGAMARSIRVLKTVSVEADRLRRDLVVQREAAETLARHLGRAQHKAEQANQAKTRFLAGMSHELRTPLNGILGYAHLLRLEGGLSPVQALRVEAMLDAGTHLLEMINSVLDLSQIEAGRLELQAAEIDPRKIAAACLDLVRPTAAGKQLSLTLAAAPEVPRHVMVDPTRVRQVLLNLLGNAVKFTERGSVELRLLTVADGCRLRIEVADTGPGIAPERRQHLFQDFRRLGNETDLTAEGAGLGLALSARLVTLMGGCLEHEDNQGTGSVFRVELPLVARPDETLASAAAEAAARAYSDRTVVQTVPEMRPLRVLVVDDMAMNREIASSFLCAAGHEVFGASDGAEAVRTVAADDFDVVLMDIRMPGMDGLEATRRIRALDGPRGQVPVVALTAQAFVEQVEQCRLAGMNDHLAKPFTPEALLASVLHAASAFSTAGAGKTASAVADDQGLAVLNLAMFDRTAAFLPAEAAIAYVQRLAEESEALLRSLPATGLAGAGTLHGQAAAAHALAGSARMFGLERLADFALCFERAVQTGSQELSSVTQDLIVTLGSSIAALRHQLARQGALC